MQKNILIVEDEEVQRMIMRKFLEGLGHNVITVSSGIEAINFILDKLDIKGVNFAQIDVMLLDLVMPDLDGFSILKQIRKVNNDLQVIVVTSSKNTSLAIRAMERGAFDYITKGNKDALQRLTSSINNALEKKDLKQQIYKLENREVNRVSFSDIVTSRGIMSRVIESAQKVSNLSIHTLINGRPGVGKDLLARAIHGANSKRDKPLIVVDCSSLKNNNFESYLFGTHKILRDRKLDKKIGKLQEADGGTLFLKRIENLTIPMQMTILCFLQDGTITPVGSRFNIKVNVRIISSSSKNIQKMIEEKKFMAELYYKLSAHTIDIPSLEERDREDVILLANNFCTSGSIAEGKKIKGISPQVLELLCNQEWDDNIRQLKNSIFKAITLCEEGFLEEEHFTSSLFKNRNTLVKSKSRIKKGSNINSELVDIYDENGNCKTLETLKEEIIEVILSNCKGNLSQSSKMLDVGRSTVYRKLSAIASAIETQEVKE